MIFLNNKLSQTNVLTSHIEKVNKLHNKLLRIGQGKEESKMNKEDSKMEKEESDKTRRGDKKVGQKKRGG